MRADHASFFLSDAEQERLLVEVVPRVLARCGASTEAIERALFDTVYEERRRLENEPDRRKAARESRFYDQIYAAALSANAVRQRELLRAMIERFAREVSGHFEPWVYAMATRAVPAGLSALLNALSPLKLLRAMSGGVGKLEDRLELSGEIEALRRVAQLGTVVLVPTHTSNLDSILVGYALYRLGLPPFLYGAGLNLFENELVGVFLHNLGAYKVDRRKTARVYKDVLKCYSSCALELGHHNLFFPGGTRSRSGAVESRLKLGLMGTALEAYISNLRQRRPSPDVFVVPCTINYQLVLEAETLIDDFLKAEGKSRYIILDDEFSRPARVLDFVRKLFSMESTIRLVFGRPIDVFGNDVDEDGVSRDPRGRPVDRRQYVLVGDAPVAEPQRDIEYTRELANATLRAFRRDSVLSATNIVCDAVFAWLRERNPGVDLYRLLRTGGVEDSLGLPEACERVGRSLARLRGLADGGQLLLDPVSRRGGADEVVNDALAHLGSYHRRAALTRRGDRLFHGDLNLILYYANRMAHLSESTPETEQIQRASAKGGATS